MVQFERLYLAKNQDIYVDRCPMVQHQIDAIRFLYRAWKKKKPGVILNDPSGYGKRVVTTLFLSAVLRTLTKPVLILCREGLEQPWMSYFQEWTKISNDVTIMLTKVGQTKKKVVISATYAAAACSKQEWSMLVVDDFISKNIMQKSDLMIWITSSAMKEDLAKFFSFYSLIYPKAKFSADNFKADQRDLNDVLEKMAMLDAFLEDIVLRRDCGVTPFPKSQSSNTSIDVTNNEPRTTKKNKDATGTKIKRSKRKSVDTTENVPNKDSKTTTENNTEVFEIGNFDNSKVHNDTTANVTGNFEMDVSGLSDEDFAPPKHKSQKSKRLWDSEEFDDDIETNKSKGENQINQENKQLDESGEQLKALRWDSETDSENDGEDVKTENTKSIRLKVNKSESSTVNHEISIAEVDSKDDLENSGSLLVNDENQIESARILVDNDVVEEIDPGNNKFSEDLFSTNLTANNEVKVKKTVNETEGTDNKLLENVNSLDAREIDNSLKQDAPIEQVKTSENANLSSFDIKMKELEERTLKKYKGSLLDSIF